MMQTRVALMLVWWALTAALPILHRDPNRINEGRDPDSPIGREILPTGYSAMVRQVSAMCDSPEFSAMTRQSCGA
jgi:hypothetical protein